VKSSILLTGTVKKIMFLGQRSWRDIESIESYVKTLPNDTICLVRAGFGFQDIVVDQKHPPEGLYLRVVRCLF
jgi:hypothetical protein